MDTKKIDEAIDAVCDRIIKDCKDSVLRHEKITNMLFALGEVLKARADMIPTIYDNCPGESEESQSE